MRLPFSYILRLPSTFCLRGQNAWEQFLSTHPAKECDDIFPVFLIGNGNFNPRTLQESATVRSTSTPGPFTYFNPRTLQESATFDVALVRFCLIDFNPRTLQESATQDPYTSDTITDEFQSTHPTRECDREWFHFARTINISIHAPYKRVRPVFQLVQIAANQFQSTHPTRECDDNGGRFNKFLNISIHAPYKRVRLSNNGKTLLCT